MDGIITLKEKLLTFYRYHEYPVQIVLRFILALMAFRYVNTTLGYFEVLTGPVPVIFLSAICALTSGSVMVLIMALVVLLHLFKLSMMLSFIALVVFAIFYLIYLKFAPDQGILMVLYPVLGQFNLHFMMPILGAMTFNPFAALPIAFSVVMMKVLYYLKEAAAGGDPGTDMEKVMESYQYVFDHLMNDKEMVAYIVVFTVVIIVTWLISRFAFNYSWYIAIIAGTVINIAGLMVQAVSVPEMNVGGIIIGSILGGVIAIILQFFGCTLDYAGREELQFEDDDYYYYVKAIPKVRLTNDAEPVEKRPVKPAKEKKSSKKASKRAKKDKSDYESAVETVKKVTKANPAPVSGKDQETKVNVKINEKTSEPAQDFDELSFDSFDLDELN